LNELYSVLTRNNLKTQKEAPVIIHELIESYEIYATDNECIKGGISLHIKHRFSYWDSLIFAAAIEFGCSTLYSEDLQCQQIIDDSLTIINPFIGTGTR